MFSITYVQVEAVDRFHGNLQHCASEFAMFLFEELGAEIPAVIVILKFSAHIIIMNVNSLLP